MTKKTVKPKPRITLTDRPNKLFVRNDEFALIDRIRKLITKRPKNPAALKLKKR